ncbi:MAG: MgtC/SapB family protein [Spirochaetales bacterium]|nr:MgtC/SapB family protein [Spirochaetales bacterium]MDY2816510.1 MgtC/SapB family protein [Bullifex sp.]MDD7008526.1 MgtC/SapB family protein [Spirochaetales bacterium]MDD7536899.1 MgtC/SapB family protein [Spirochaetales bacterium]MDY5055737.1 MgtC/SapB family protein [Bullifex sp.]
MTEYLLGTPEWEYLIRITLAALCGGIIGYEREKRLKNAGIRTHILVSMSAALMMVISKYGFNDVLSNTGIGIDASRVAASVVSAIGFLGAGVIFVRKENTIGVTTAAGLWSTVGLGLAIGAGMYVTGTVFTFMVLAIQLLLHNRRFRFSTQTTGAITLKIDSTDFTIGQVNSIFREKKLDVRNIRLTLQDGGQLLSAIIIFSKKDNLNDVVHQLESIGTLTSIEITTFG